MTQLRTSALAHSVRAEVCSLFGYSRQAYYKSLHKSEQAAFSQDILLQYISDVRKRQPRLGVRKLYHLLQEHYPSDLLPGRDLLFALLREEGLLVRRSKRKAYTTNSRHRFYKHPNLVRDFVPDSPGELYVSDITYIEVEKKVFFYLSIVTDAYSRKIVGWYLTKHYKAKTPSGPCRWLCPNMTDALP